MCAAALALAVAACGDDGATGGVGATVFEDEVPESPPVASEAVSLSPMRTRARAANDHLLNYGTWSDAELAIAKTYDVVVVDPADGVTRALVQSIQGGTGPGDRVIVLCYLSIGEDIRTADRTDAQLATDARFKGDGTGPRMDPRGPYADGESLTGIDPLGLPSNGGTGYASYYLDDVSVRNGAGNVGDGIPDRNGNFGGAFVNAGDPKWFDALQEMRLDGVDRVAGLREILTTTYGRGLGCDGLFLDTIDTAAPNFSLGYAEGPASEMAEATLVGGSTVGTASLLEDVRVTERLAGFRHYLTDFDFNRVGYALYLRTTPFDFVADPTLATATRVPLDPKVPTAYADGAGPTTFAHEATIPNLTPGQLYYLVIRAVDEVGNEERNQVVLTGTPDGSTQSLGNLSAQTAWREPVPLHGHRHELGVDVGQEEHDDDRARGRDGVRPVGPRDRGARGHAGHQPRLPDTSSSTSTRTRPPATRSAGSAPTT